MQKRVIIHFLVLVICNISYAQINVSDIEIVLIQKSLQKSYALKKATRTISIDSLQQKNIKQNFIPTLELEAKYGYGASRINLDAPTVTLPITGIDLFEGESRFDAKGQVLNANLTAKALLFAGMQVTYGSKATEEKIKAKNFMLEAEKATIIKDMIDTFNKIELLKKSEIVIQKSEERLAKEKLKVVKAIENGLAIPFDRDKITAAELNLASTKVALYGSLNLLYAKLEMLTGESIEHLEQNSYQLQPWVLMSEKGTFSDRPELKALKASINAYEYKLKMNKNAFLPKVQAQASMSYSNLFNADLKTPYQLSSGEIVDLRLNKFELFPTYFVGVGLQWELFSGLKHGSKVSIVKIEREIALNEKNEAEEKLALFYQKIHMDFEVKNQQLKFKEKEMKVAKNNLDLAIKSYKKGLISITDRLQSETDYQKAAFSYYKFVAAQRLVAIDLLIATGSLNIENLNN